MITRRNYLPNRGIQSPGGDEINEEELFTKSQDAMSWQPAAAAWPVTTPITGTGI